MQFLKQRKKTQKPPAREIMRSMSDARSRRLLFNRFQLLSPPKKLGVVLSGLGALMVVYFVFAFLWMSHEDRMIYGRHKLYEVANLFCRATPNETSNWASTANVVASHPKVFQIGFNKCGTRTLCDLFNQNGLPCFHHNLRTDFTCLGAFEYPSHALSIDSGALDILEIAKHYVLVSDFGIIEGGDITGLHLPSFVSKNLTDLAVNEIKRRWTSNRFWFGRLDKYYEFKSLFVLNVRNVHAWLLSRSIHENDFGSNYLVRTQRMYSFEHSKIEILNLWRNMWYEYICRVLVYFRIRGMDRLLIFDIENDDPKLIADFFGKHGFDIDASKYGVMGKSQVGQGAKTQYDPEILQWVETQRKKWPWFGETNEKNAIRKVCQVEDI